jgi:hydroxymethylglutaryl-CoA reductase
MLEKKSISGFSKLSKRQKMRWLVETFFKDPDAAAFELTSWWMGDEKQQSVLDGFTENVISNYPLPFSVAPNFLINGKMYAVPMVIEESSVVAAAASAAKFWLERGGFHAKILDTQKLGQVHFQWLGRPEKLKSHFYDLKKRLISDAKPITANMEKRGGGILDIELLDFTEQEIGLWQLRASFETCDSMGANFINSVLENFARTLETWCATNPDFGANEREVTVIMAILSNYTPDCLVRVWVECPLEKLDGIAPELSGCDFAQKFATAVRIARIDPYRATTHNKGIFNGIDSVVLATANDFRAIEACGHTYAARDGQYRSLSQCEIRNDLFHFWMDLPLAVGTVGGLTSLHPVARRALELLGNPSAQDLMKIIATVGLAQNFAAVRSLVTTGIQKGHMKMHLTNILSNFAATPVEVAEAAIFFQEKTISHSSVRAFLETKRGVKV